MSKAKWIAGGVVIVLLAGGYLFLNKPASKQSFGNPGYFSSSAQLAAATTSINYIQPGLATTTITFDSFGQSGSGQNRPTTDTLDSTPADSATLLVQFTASSTGSILNIAYEYSQDNVDWYQDAVFTPGATSTPTIDTTVIGKYVWTFASSTVGGIAAISTNNLATRIITVPTPTRYIRAVVSVPIGAKNAAVWAQFIPRKQVPGARY